MPFTPDTATLSVLLAPEVHTVADVRFTVDALDGIVAAGVWGALAADESRERAISRARSLIARELLSSKARRRFFPEWTDLRDPEVLTSLDPKEQFNPFDPMDGGVRDGLNSFLRRTLWVSDRETYSQLFGFAVVQRVEHHSPFLIELTIALTGAVILPALLVAGVMRAVARERRSEAEARIREAEASIREEELAQKKLQTRILEEIAQAAHELGPQGIPASAIEKAAQVSTTSVADLKSSPLIGSLTLGFSSGTK
jgi:hypothetical protein